MKIDADDIERMKHDLLHSEEFTFPRPPATGFMVGGAGGYTQIPIDHFLLEVQLTEAINKAAKSAARDEYIGGWFDRSTWAYEIECSTHCITRDWAIRVAKRRKQKMIFDLKKKESIPVPE